jgi:hypothetical protein
LKGWIVIGRRVRGREVKGCKKVERMKERGREGVR